MTYSINIWFVFLYARRTTGPIMVSPPSVCKLFGFRTITYTCTKKLLDLTKLGQHKHRPSISRGIGGRQIREYLMRLLTPGADLWLVVDYLAITFEVLIPFWWNSHSTLTTKGPPLQFLPGKIRGYLMRLLQSDWSRVSGL
jgi:hypothetical protein